MSKEGVFAGLDAGGTEFKCVVGRDPDTIMARTKVAVQKPADTLAECVAFFKQASRQFGPLQTLGIGSFGPVDLHRSSANYGRVTSTPKPYWQNTDIVGYFERALAVAINFDTDVNAALLGEQTWGAALGLHSAVYATVGTGIGAGAAVDGRLLHGAMHLEVGHMRIPKAANDTFAGCCPYHGDCLEGLASGPAISRRWSQNAANLPDDHPAWALQAHYLALMCVNFALTYSPQRIILGGGVMQRAGLLTQVQTAYRERMAGYLGSAHEAAVDEFIVGAELGQEAGAMGALVLAQRAIGV